MASKTPNLDKINAQWSRLQTWLHTGRPQRYATIRATVSIIRGITRY